MTSTASGALPSVSAYHRLPVRLLNRGLRAVNAIGLGRAQFEADALMARARSDTGLTDFGDDRFVEPLRRICDGLNNEAGLHPVGAWLTRVSLLRLLRHRLWAEALIARHPDILEREIRAPLVVVGLARSGTTRLHRLLAADEGFLHLKAWESVNPVPWPGSIEARAKGRPDPRIRSIEQGLKAVLYMSPQIASVHPLGAFEVEEEVGLIQHAFSSQLFEVITRLPTFGQYLMNTDQTYAYEYMVRLMKIISWWRGDDDRPWVLKSPQHMQDLDALLQVFPDARLVFTHRDPVKVVGSACSMVWNSMVRDTDVLDPHWIGREWLNKTDAMLRKTLRVRESVPARQQLDVLYHDISVDWRAAVSGIYRHFGWELTDQTLRGMQSWIDDNARHKHGTHKYQLADFGLDTADVAQRLRYYSERFAIPAETCNPHLSPGRRA